MSRKEHFRRFFLCYKNVIKTARINIIKNLFANLLFLPHTSTFGVLFEYFTPPFFWRWNSKKKSNARRLTQFIFHFYLWCCSFCCWFECMWQSELYWVGGSWHQKSFISIKNKIYARILQIMKKWGKIAN